MEHAGTRAGYLRVPRKPALTLHGTPRTRRNTDLVVGMVVKHGNTKFLILLGAPQIRIFIGVQAGDREANSSTFRMRPVEMFGSIMVQFRSPNSAGKWP